MNVVRDYPKQLILHFQVIQKKKKQRHEKTKIAFYYFRHLSIIYMSISNERVTYRFMCHVYEGVRNIKLFIFNLIFSVLILLMFEKIHVLQPFS